MNSPKFLRGLACGLALTTLAPLQAAELPKLAGIAALDYREQARYPEWSRPVLEAVDPLLAGRAPTRQSLSNAQGQTLSLWNSSISAERGQSLDLFAQPDAGNWEVTGTALSSLGTLAEFAYADDGKGADRIAGDGIHSARLTLPAAHQPALGTADNIMVKVAAENAAGETLRAVTGFVYSRPGAVLTGHYRHGIEKGNLVIQAQMEVLTQGRYHLAGTIADLSGLPLAQAQTAGEYAPGTHWIEMPVYGLIFHELGALGPLKVSSLTLTSANGMPNALGPVIENPLNLGILPLAELTREPFNDARLLDTAERLEASLPVAQPVVRRVRGLLF